MASSILKTVATTQEWRGKRHIWVVRVRLSPSRRPEGVFYILLDGCHLLVWFELAVGLSGMEDLEISSMKL